MCKICTVSRLEHQVAKWHLFNACTETPLGFCGIDGPAIRNPNRGDSRDARIDLQENPYVHNVRVIRVNPHKPMILNYLVPRKAIRKKGVWFGNPQPNRANQAIRANLRIDSCESGHLSSAGGPRDFLRILGGSDAMHVTLGNC